MGGFYGSVQVRTGDRGRVVGVAGEVAGGMGVRCLVGPEMGEWVGVYPEGSGQDSQFGEAMAAKLDGEVLHLMVHDDDIFAYWFYRGGRLVDSFWSKPGYFGEENRASEEAMGGDAEAFRGIVGDGVKRLGALLERGEEGAAFASETLGAFAKVLKIANAVTAYEYLTEGEREGVKGWRKFTHVPETAVDGGKEAKRAASEARRRAREEVARERKRLTDEGYLLLRETREESNPIACGTVEGFLVFWWARRGGGEPVCYRESWRKGGEVAVGFPQFGYPVACDASGIRIAVSMHGGIGVFDVADGVAQSVAHVPEKDSVQALAISADGTTVAHLSRFELFTTKVGGSVRAHVGWMVRGHRLAVHPSGEWVAGTTGNLSLASLAETPRVVQVHVGGRRQILEKQRAAIIEQLESSMESRNAKATRQQLEEKLAAMWRSMPATSTEEPWAVGFSRNGCWIWCGTERGIRVYDWPSAVKEEHAKWMLPHWKFDVPKTSDEEGRLAVRTITEEPDGGGIAFGGDGGTVYRLDLETGEARVVVALPGLVKVDSLTFSVDGRYLGVVSKEAKVERRSLWPKTYWEVWDYSKLLARVG